eukprot:TRINITY_DN144_c0_g1_i1.p1 TRINITY_DN144_c0_g1~~TRINITY_DN144_c0_g1_i1.p1  ORF type:complete len:346 (-),score=60.59 TRINITY_DN144_c0_g1_i1:240-1277(-)
MCWKLVEKPAKDVQPDEEPSVDFYMTNGDQTLNLQPRTADTYPSETRSWVRDNVRCREGDIVISTFPKCGTTLTEQVVLLLLNGGDAGSLDPLSKNSANLNAGFGKVWPDVSIRPQAEVDAYKAGSLEEEFIPKSLEWFEALPSPRVLKNHANVRKAVTGPGDGLLADGVKYVVCTRNPLDACTSCYYHAWNPSANGWPFDAWVEAWLRGDEHSSCGSWFSWHRDWHALAQSDQLLWLHYEEMVSEPHVQVRRIAEFLEIDYNDALIDHVVEGSSFSSMKKAAVTAKQKAKDRSNTDDHLRSGKRGDWRAHFDAKEVEKVRAVFAREMSGTGLCYDLGEGDSISA